MDLQMIKFLLNHGADPHIEDEEGLDCCDKGRLYKRYNKINIFHDNKCKINKELR